MTDKQIIIDGIDVSECEAYKDKHCKDKTSIMFCDTNLCSNFPNCYYKQLKAKEQECDELKSILEVIAGRPCFNPNDCNGHCLPNCKWNAHKLAQKALGNDF